MWLKRALFLGLVSVTTLKLYGQGTITVSNARPIQQVVRDLAGNGVIIFNVTTDCELSVPSAGEFTNTGPMAIQQGLVMTTGSIWDVPNNDGGGTTFISRGATPDPDLNTIDGPTYDLCAIEFDFITMGDTLRFNYVFGSEEYEEYVGSEFNDVFGFFLSGPGIAGTVNLAVVPGTTTPVTINTINQNTNSAYYVRNTGGQYPYIEYDGFTTKLTAEHPVIPCDTYHIKLAIADVADALLDAGVFIEKGSFTTGAADAQYIPIGGNTTNEVTEGCIQGAVVISVNPVPPSPRTVYIYYGGNAINGVDVDTLPDSVVLGPSNPADTLLIVPLLDTLTEGPETLLVYIEGACGLGVDTQMIIINDPVYVNILTPDTTICEYDTLFLQAESNSPILNWEPSVVACDSCLNTYLIGDSSLQLILIAGVGACQDTDTVSITVIDITESGLPPDTFWCVWDSLTLSANIGADSYQWFPDTLVDCDTCPTVNILTNDTITFFLTIKDSFCQLVDTITVYPVKVDTISIPDTLMCEGDTFRISLPVHNQYTWYPDSFISCTNCPDPSIYPPDTMLYIVAISNPYCPNNDTDSVWVFVDPIPRVNLINDTIMCEDDTIRLNAPIGPYTYQWFPSFAVDCDTCSSVILTALGNYDVGVYVYTPNGCPGRDSFSLITIPLPDFDLPDTFVCLYDTLHINIDSGVRYDYYWSPSIGLSDTTSPIVDIYVPQVDTITYSVTVTNFNCAYVDSFQLIIRPLPYIPIPDDTLLCDSTPLSLDAGPWVTFQWIPPSAVNCPTCQQVVHIVDDTMDISVFVVDQYGCENTHTIRVYGEDPPYVYANPDTIEICTPDSFTISITGYGSAFLWYNDKDTSVVATGTANAFYITDTTVFTVVAQPIQVCKPDTTYSVIYAHPVPEVTTAPDTMILEGTPAFIDGEALNSVTHWWEPSALVPNPYELYNQIEPIETVMLVLTGVNLLGCTDADTMWVYVVRRPPCTDSALFVPLAFTPNGDGINDVFYLYTHSIDLEVTVFRVYDRWGTLLFEATDVQFDPATGQSNVGWDGTYDGQLLRPDVYVYYVEYKCKVNDYVIMKKGDVTLIR